LKCDVQFDDEDDDEDDDDNKSISSEIGSNAERNENIADEDIEES
jgi:hypothetical protein